MYRSASLTSTHENYSRSILKPEYTHWGNDGYPAPSHVQPHKRSMPRRQSVHPYSRYMADFSMPNVRGSYNHEGLNRQKSLDYGAAAIKHRYMNMQKMNNRQKFPGDSPSKAHQKSSPPARSPHHGQAEQLRRSRESNTFSLIDAQLSKVPLDRIRDMYLQVKGISTNAGNVPRTTKKANLSAVHAIVRFRIRDYLVDLREHSRRLLDQVIANQKPDDSNQRHKDIDQIYANLSPFPCSRDCIHCEKLHTRPERPRVTPVRRLPMPNRPPPVVANRTPYQPPLPAQPQSNKIPTSGIRVKTEEPLFSMPKIASPPQPSVLTNDSSQFSNSDPDDFLSLEPELPSFVPDFGVGVKLEELDEGPQLKRNRIDSNVTRFCQELGLSAIDWSVDAAGLSGEMSMDFNQLLFGGHESPSFSAGEDDNLCSPATCGDDSDTALSSNHQHVDSLLLGAAANDIQVS